TGGRQIRRDRIAEPPRRGPLDFVRRDRQTKRLEQNAGIAVRGLRRIESADDRLDGIDRVSELTQMADQRRGHIGLADVGAGRGDEDGAHEWRPITRVRTIPARRSISASGCCAVKAKRSRAVPAGTVGGRMATTRKPPASSISEAASAASASPTMTGTMALCASGRLSARVKSLALRNGAPVKTRSRSIRSSAAMAAATTGGGRPVE